MSETPEFDRFARAFTNLARTLQDEYGPLTERVASALHELAKAGPPLPGEGFVIEGVCLRSYPKDGISIAR